MARVRGRTASECVKVSRFENECVGDSEVAHVHCTCLVCERSQDGSFDKMVCEELSNGPCACDVSGGSAAQSVGMANTAWFAVGNPLRPVAKN